MRRINLTTARHLAREWRAIYREARCGRLPLADASRLAYLLQVGCRMYEVQTLEDRVVELERMASDEAPRP